MANISITNVCNKRCIYCFAQDARNESVRQYMDDRLFGQILDYLERSKIDHVRLMGGEPTLHPHFISFAGQALSRGLNLFLFSNGLMPAKVIDFLRTIPAEKVKILLNTIHPEEGNLRGIQRQKKLMKILGPVIVPGINIYKPALDLDFISGYFSKFNLKKEVRIGISHPVISNMNRYLHPRFYPRVGKQIVAFRNEMEKIGVRITLDCGFVPCMFPIEEMNFIFDELKMAGN